MKASHRTIARLLPLSGALVAAACVPAPEPTPAPTRTPVQTAPAPAPSPSPAPVPAPANWMDAPRTAGNWTYRRDSQQSFATYGTGASPIETVFILTCNAPARTITLARSIRGANDAASLIIRTETADRTLRARARVSQAPLLVAELAARDPLFDAMALTKGRFAVETAGQDTLYLPSWAEVSRVIEDCR